jgi:hypothetical protein
MAELVSAAKADGIPTNGRLKAESAATFKASRRLKKLFFDMAWLTLSLRLRPGVC